MFTLIESKVEIAKVQRKLEASIRRDFKKKVIKNIGYPGGTRKDVEVVTNGQYWYWTADNDHLKSPNPKRLNWFGIFHDDDDLQISVEINTTHEGANAQIAGFFARDNNTGLIYLFHSGRVGGGTPGVSKSAMLTWSGQKLIEVFDSAGRGRDGVLVMPVEGLAAIRSAICYVETIAKFKQAVRDGATKTNIFKKQEKQLKDFYSEARGRRKGKRTADFDFFSRHGEVVDALQKWRKSVGMIKSSRLVKNVHIDLGVSLNGSLTEVYEVKTSALRPDVYTAIGQLVVHGSTKACKRIIVLPYSCRLAKDLESAIKRNAIETVRFKLTENSAQIVRTDCKFLTSS
jgi:hypothetical protein